MSNSLLPARRALIRIAYLMPLFTCLVLVVYALIPHLYFLYDRQAYETLSVFALLGNTWDECHALLSSGEEVSAAAFRFAVVMGGIVILTWVLLLLYIPVAVASAICSCIAFSKAPTDQSANHAKRWFRFVCPGRVLFAVVNLFPLLLCAFPTILLSQYRELFWYDMSLHYLGPNDLILGAVFVLVTLCLFFLTCHMQAREHMDMFRLYKSKKDQITQ